MHGNGRRALFAGVIALLYTLISVSVGQAQNLTIPLELGAIIGLLLYLCIRN
ncbi:hypothetical protein [Alicyclobacillus ferrooxydans]|uniref:hypothetical protein n=1 Tax=Alicyclobacillus ferrooxydans TaxID=471514 RepID=UPI000A459DDB|nr:hypothetical protein [Alicyclobacillus ferrooxydans]